jgi:Flp pilus assembly protein TadD
VNKYTLSKGLHTDASDLNHEAYRRGYSLFKDRDFTKARDAFGEALDYWPKDSQAWMALGNCEDELGDPKAAERSFRKALLCCNDKNITAIRFNLANSLLDQERYHEAIDLYAQVPSDCAFFPAVKSNLEIARRLLRDRGE